MSPISKVSPFEQGVLLSHLPRKEPITYHVLVVRIDGMVLFHLLVTFLLVILNAIHRKVAHKN